MKSSTEMILKSAEFQIWARKHFYLSTSLEVYVVILIVWVYGK